MSKDMQLRTMAGEASRSLALVTGGMPDNARSLFTTMLNDAEHFVLPSGGYILDDNLKGLSGLSPDQIRLPYKNITLSVVDKDQRVFIAAQQIETVDELRAHIPESEFLVTRELDDIEGPFVLLSPWTDRVEGMLLPVKAVSVAHLREDDTTMSIFFFDPKDYNALSVEGFKLLQRSALATARVVLELIEALACSNIVIDTLPPSAKKSTKRQRKLKHYDTKVLVVETPKLVGGGASRQQFGERGKTRAHLRRGHIRRYKASGKTIWINSMHVGDKDLGFVNKSYSVKDGEQ